MGELTDTPPVPLAGRKCSTVLSRPFYPPTLILELSHSRDMFVFIAIRLDEIYNLILGIQSDEQR